MTQINDIMLRMGAIETETISTANAVPYSMHDQYTFPFFVHRLSGVQYRRDSSDIQIAERIFTIRMITGYATENYDGLPEETLYDYVQLIEVAFNDRDGRRLVSAAYPDVPTYLHPLYCNLQSSAGFVVFQRDNAANQTGVDWTIQVPVWNVIE